MEELDPNHVQRTSENESKIQLCDRKLKLGWASVKWRPSYPVHFLKWLFSLNYYTKECDVLYSMCSKSKFVALVVEIKFNSTFLTSCTSCTIEKRVAWEVWHVKNIRANCNHIKPHKLQEKLHRETLTNAGLSCYVPVLVNERSFVRKRMVGAPTYLELIPILCSKYQWIRDNKTWEGCRQVLTLLKQA